MNIKQLSLALSLAAGAALSTSALAQMAPLAPADITFNGNILSSVCTPELGGAQGQTVTLQDATVAELAVQGMTAKPKDFDITVSCPMNLVNVTQFWAHFEGGSVNTNGRFVAQTGSTNVSFQLLDADDNDTVIKAGGIAGTGGPGTDQGTGSTVFSSGALPLTAKKNYRVQYYAENGLTNADAGAVSADGTYTVYFY